jgi:hypothetical protein
MELWQPSSKSRSTCETDRSIDEQPNLVLCLCRPNLADCLTFKSAFVHSFYFGRSDEIVIDFFVLFTLLTDG